MLPYFHIPAFSRPPFSNSSVGHEHGAHFSLYELALPYFHLIIDSLNIVGVMVMFVTVLAVLPTMIKEVCVYLFCVCVCLCLCLSLCLYVLLSVSVSLEYSKVFVILLAVLPAMVEEVCVRPVDVSVSVSVSVSLSVSVSVCLNLCLCSVFVSVSVSVSTSVSVSVSEFVALHHVSLYLLLDYIGNVGCVRGCACCSTH